MFDEIRSMMMEMGDEELAEVYEYVKMAYEGRRKRSEMMIVAMNGIVEGDIRERTRRHQITWGRFIVLYELLGMGWSTQRAGDVFGMDHSSVVYARDQVENMLSCRAGYANELKMYKEFKNRIKNEMRLAG